MGIRICINGYRGRMGQAIEAAAIAAGHEITGKIDIGEDLDPALADSDALIDFSFHTVTESAIESAIRHSKPIVIGTTGHSHEEKQRLLKLAERTPCVWAGNFSIGVNLLCYLTEKAASILPMGYNAEIVEMHHRMKKDAASGTALMLAESVMNARESAIDDLRHGREGVVGERTEREIGMHSLRGGDVVGDHTVMFAELGERIELTHKASDRSIFARGAVTSANWLVSKKPGIYSIRQVLGLE